MRIGPKAKLPKLPQRSAYPMPDDREMWDDPNLRANFLMGMQEARQRQQGLQQTQQQGQWERGRAEAGDLMNRARFDMEQRRMEITQQQYEQGRLDRVQEMQTADDRRRNLYQYEIQQKEQAEQRARDRENQEVENDINDALRAVSTNRATEDAADAAFERKHRGMPGPFRVRREAEARKKQEAVEKQKAAALARLLESVPLSERPTVEAKAMGIPVAEGVNPLAPDEETYLNSLPPDERVRQRQERVTKGTYGTRPPKPEEPLDSPENIDKLIQSMSAHETRRKWFPETKHIRDKDNNRVYPDFVELTDDEQIRWAREHLRRIASQGQSGTAQGGQSATVVPASAPQATAAVPPSATPAAPTSARPDNWERTFSLDPTTREQVVVLATQGDTRTVTQLLDMAQNSDGSFPQVVQKAAQKVLLEAQHRKRGTP
jgi:hypothetical protein